MQETQMDRDEISIHQYWPILKRRWLPMLLVLSSTIGLAAFVTLQLKPRYEAQGKLLFNKNDRMSSLTGLAGGVGELSGLTQQTNPLDTQAEIIRSNPLVEKTISMLKLRNDEGLKLSIEEFLKRLKVSSVRGTDVLSLSYQSEDAKQAALVINTLMKNYLENDIYTNRAETVAARQFITKQLPEVEARVSRSEADLRAFKEQNQVIALEEEAKAAVEKLSDLADQLTKAGAELADANSRTAAIQQQLKLNVQQAVTLSTVSQTPAVQQALTEYQQIQEQLALERTRYQDGHPAIINLLQKEAALKQQLQNRVAQVVGSTQPISEQNLQLGPLKQNLTADLVKVEVERLGLASRVSILNRALSIYKQRASTLPKLEQNQSELERQLQVARSTYEQLLKRLQEVQVLENQNVGNARIVSSALIPEKPVSPKIPLNMAIGGLVGVLGALGIALLLESIDKSVKTVEEAKQLLGYPLLGTIPRMSQKDRGHTYSALPTRDNPYSPVNSAFEMLQANLGFSLPDKELKVMVVTSAVPTEGKSFVASNLATAMVQSGKRVLLIDADMRCPRQHTIWQLSNFKGLSEVLAGQADYQTVMTEAMINLHVLSAGTTPPNPVALLDSKRMISLVEEVSQSFDVVVIDTPPVTLVADGLLLGKLVDGMLLVVRPGTSDSGSISLARTLLQQATQRVLGIVINGVTTENGSGYYSGHYYSYSRSSNADHQQSITRIQQ